METMEEIIPFAKEMLDQKAGRGMLKIYMLGSTLAMLGAVGGVMHTLLTPFMEQDADEDLTIEKILGKRSVLKMHAATLIHSDDVEVMETVVMEEKAKPLALANQRSSANRLHAS